MLTDEETKEDIWPNFVVDDWYATADSLEDEFKLIGILGNDDWEEWYLDRCYRLAPKELMVWSK